MEKRVINILHIVTSVGFGGVSVFLYNYYSHMDRDDIHFDIIAIDFGNEQAYASRFRELGANVYYMPKNYFRRLIFLFRHLATHQYDIIHSHMELQSAIYLSLAKMFGIKIRIAHAHMAFADYSSLKFRLLQKLLNSVSTHKWGCSLDALRCLFGKKYANPDNVVYNAMNVDQFLYDPSVRDSYRKDMGLKDKFVVGFVGRFVPQKNVIYLTEIFHEVKKLIPNAIFMACGDGQQRDEMLESIRRLGIEDSVLMLGNRTDVNCFLQAMDVFVLPSRWEGLGIVLIEAQAASLRCVAAKDTIPFSTKVTDYIDYISIDAEPKEWALHIKEHCLNYPRKDMRKEIADAHYDIATEAPRLEQRYRSIMKFT